MVLRLDEDNLTRDNEREEDNSSRKKVGKALLMSRVNFLRVALMGGFTVLGWKLWDLQVNTPPEERQLATRTQVRDITIKPPRGVIYDRFGNPLVRNIPTYSVTITRAGLPPRLSDKEIQALIKAGQKVVDPRQEVYDNLARFLGMTYVIGCVPDQILNSSRRNETLNILEPYLQISAQDIEKKLYLRSAQKLATSFMSLLEKIPLADYDRYLPLRDMLGVYFLSQGERLVLEAEFRTADFEPVVVWPSLSREDANILDEKRLDLPGVGILQGYVRRYERPDLLSHLLGYTGVLQDNDELDRYNRKASGNQPAVYPDGTVPRKVYSIDDQVGRQGIEASMEEFLRGEKGGRAVQVDNAGNIVQTLAGSEQKAVPGHSVYLAMDPNIQAAATKAILEEIAAASAKKQASNLTGASVVLDVETGEVVALVSIPTYNNNLFRSNLTTAEDNELATQLTDKRNPLINRSIQGVYSPGSTFKLITSLAGLNENSINLSTTFDCTQYIWIPSNVGEGTSRDKFKCWGKHGSVNIESAITQSCDIFFYNVAQNASKDAVTGKQLAYYTAPDSKDPINFKGMGITKLQKYMDMFGLGKQTGIELPDEYPGLLQTPETFPKDHQGNQWSLGDTITTAIGQNDTQMTPLQVCLMTATIANGGTLIRPRLVKRVVDNAGNEVVKDERFIMSVLEVSQTHLATVKRGMRKVVLPGGTAESQMANQMGNLTVAGKTGTAEYGESYGQDASGNLLFPTLAWFTCFAPYEKPRYAVTTLITTAENQIEGSTFAVPAAKKILQALFPKETGVKA
jgi:penicillin-binding protein 2